MSKNRDALLTTIASFANEKIDDLKTDITLAIGGMLVSGYVASASQYYEHHVVSKAFGESLSRLIEQEISEKGEEEGTPPTMFIHLRNARYWTPGGTAIPTSGEGIFIRVKIEDVSAFNFGSISKD